MIRRYWRCMSFLLRGFGHVIDTSLEIPPLAGDINKKPRRSGVYIFKQKNNN